MLIYVLIADGQNIVGVYSSKTQLLTDLISKFKNIIIDKIEIWNDNGEFVEYFEKPII